MKGQRKSAEKQVSNSDEMKTDRLSNLPGPVIHHILSLMDTKYAVQTCVLSKKWTRHWTHIHTLKLDFSIFRSEVSFANFVRFVLHQLNQSFTLRGLNFFSKYSMQCKMMENSVLSYAKSRGIKELETNTITLYSDLSHFPALVTLKLVDSILDCPFQHASLTTLCLSGASFMYFPSEGVVFDGQLKTLFNCPNLENLVLDDCELGHSLEISAPQLVNLTISNFPTDNPYRFKVIISAPTPSLKFFNFSGSYLLELSIVESPVLEKVNIELLSPSVSLLETMELEEMCDSNMMLELAKTLSHAKSLKISWNFLDCRGQFVSNHLRS